MITSKLVADVVAERGKVYGDPYEGWRNMGLVWTALIQQHYAIELPHAIPASLAAMMMAALKIQRSARVFKEDNYIDLSAYAGFAQSFQVKESGGGNDL